MAGTLDGDTGLATAAQIHTSDKGDYYSLGDPQAEVYAHSGHDVYLKTLPGKR